MINQKEIQSALTEYSEKTQNITIHKRLAFYDGVLWAIKKMNSQSNDKNFDVNSCNFCNSSLKSNFKFCPECGIKQI